MAQFDTHRYRAAASRAKYVVDVQSNLLDAFSTRLVIPVYVLTADARPISRLNPIVEIENRPHYLSTQEMAAIRRDVLGEKVASLLPHRDAIIAAVDLLITGI